MKDRLLANTASLGITVALLALALFLFLLQPHWPVIEHWQADSGFKTYSGYMLLLIMAAMWLPLWLRKRFDQPQQLDLIKLMHQWLGVLVLLLFVLHASIARSGYLALQTLLLLALSGLGAGIAWTQLHGRTSGRRWMVVTHIAMAFVVSSFSLLHLYFIYAYVG